MPALPAAAAPAPAAAGMAARRAVAVIGSDAITWVGASVLGGGTAAAAGFT